jgi:hypothetical protein
MVRRLNLTVEIRERRDGSFEAHCPELAISARGRYAEEAVDNLQQTVLSSLSEGFNVSFYETNNLKAIEDILMQNPHCYFAVPQDPQVH